MACRNSGTRGRLCAEYERSELRSRLSSAAISTVTAFGRYPCAIWGAVFSSRSCADCPLLTPRKRQLFSGHKIVVAGMCRRLEAAWDDGGRALGVQVFAAVHPVDSWYLLGLLNSKLLSYLFRARFEAKRLGSGFLSVNKGQLAHLPVRLIQPNSAGERRQHDMIVHRVGEVLALQSRSTTAAGPDADELASRLQQLEQQIDELIYKLYRLTKPEIQLVEESIAHVLITLREMPSERNLYHCSFPSIGFWCIYCSCATVWNGTQRPTRQVRPPFQAVPKCK